jgi:hypothetical protein
MTIKRGLILLVAALVVLASYRWWISRQPTPPPAAFTQVCAVADCPDDEAIYALLGGKLGRFRRVPQVAFPDPRCAPSGATEVYRPAYTADYRFALVGIIDDGVLTESYTLLFRRTDSGWIEVGPYGIRGQTYDCHW